VTGGRKAPSIRRSTAAGTRRLRVGVLDLLYDTAPQGWGDSIYSRHFRRQFTSIMPQAVAVWSRQLGHRVSYATYYGQADPLRLLPGELDVLFVCAYTRASALAYALSRQFRWRGTLTVLGGPHARAFPQDALRFFDLVVGDCDRQLVADVLAGRFDPPRAVTSSRTLEDLPSVEERLPELRQSSLGDGRSLWRSVPILTSLGCPYACDFCVDWNTHYRRVADERLIGDLRFVSEHLPRTIVGFHDPNFGVQFDRTMEAIESVPEERRTPYVMESSLSVLKESRIERLGRSRCVYIASGIESWAEYSRKAAAGGMRARDKLASVVRQFELLREHVEGFQANFVFGTDADRGHEPVELTKELVRSLPFVWPGVNIPTPFGGTPLFDRYRREGRMLETLPFAFYYNPYLTFVPAHYSPAALYDHLIDLFSLMTSLPTWVRRLTSKAHPLVRLVHSVQAFGAHHELAEFRRIRRLLHSDAGFRAFHDGRSRELPTFYRSRLARRLGRYAELLDDDDLRPRLEPSTPAGPQERRVSRPEDTPETSSTERETGSPRPSPLPASIA
jgi:hypothetical protein